MEFRASEQNVAEKELLDEMSGIVQICKSNRGEAQKDKEKKGLNLCSMSDKAAITWVKIGLTFTHMMLLLLLLQLLSFFGVLIK